MAADLTVVAVGRSTPVRKPRRDIRLPRVPVAKPLSILLTPDTCWWTSVWADAHRDNHVAAAAPRRNHSSEADRDGTPSLHVHMSGVDLRPPEPGATAHASRAHTNDVHLTLSSPRRGRAASRPHGAGLTRRSRAGGGRGGVTTRSTRPRPVGAGGARLSVGRHST